MYRGARSSCHESNPACKIANKPVPLYRQEVIAQGDFYAKLAKVIPGLLPWQDVFNATATPPSQVKKLRSQQIAAFRLYSRSRPYLIALGVLAAILLLGPRTLELVRN